MSVPIVKYKLNLQEIFGETIPDDDEFKERFTQAVIDRIIERTQSGIDKDSRPFKKYSKKYAASKGQDNVDMTVFGDMLESIDLIESTSQTITLGFSDDQNPKAYNHTIGDTLPKRDFFGLPKKDLAELAESFSDELKALKDINEDRDFEVAEDDLSDVIRGILQGNFDEDLGI